MAAKKRKPNPGVAANPASTSTPIVRPTPRVPPLPLAEYYPIVPIHIIIVMFCVLVLPSRSLFPSASPSKTSSYSALSLPKLLQPLIAHPIKHLSLACGALVLVQTWWGYRMRRFRKDAGKTIEQVEKERRSSRIIDMAGSGGSGRLDLPKLVGPLLESFIISLLASLLIHVLLVLLGAPFVLKLPHTFALAVLLSLLAVWPTAYTIGWNEGREKATWVRMYSAFEPRNDLEVAMFAPAVGTVLGCWTGAFPIPLDWDRPWQAWPTTCVVGAVAGHTLGSVVAMGWIAVRSVQAEEREKAVASPPTSPQGKSVAKK